MKITNIIWDTDGEIVENLPKALKEGVSKEEAEKVKAQFAEVGAKVEIK